MIKGKVLLRATLVFPVTETRVLLARKTRHIGEGFLNGFGGGLESSDHNDVTTAAARELWEESGLLADRDALEERAVVDFHNQMLDKKVFTCRVHVFLAHQWTGEIMSTQEMANPAWYLKHPLPFEDMMPADALWLPQVLTGKVIFARAWYGPNQRVLLGKGCIYTETSTHDLLRLRP